MSPGAVTAWYDHLVGRGGAVGDEENVVRTDGTGEFFLRNLDVAGRLEHAVQAAGGGRGLGEEQVLAVELAHVADPVRLHDRLAACDRQGVKGGDRPGRVALQVVEERSGIALGDAFENVEVHLHQLLDLVEHAADHRGRRVTRHLLHLPVAQEVDVEFRANALDEPGQRHADLVRRKARRIQLGTRGQKIVHQRHVVLRGHGDSVKDHHRLDLAVHDSGDQGILDAADEHRLVDHRVLDASQLPELPGDFRPICGRHRADEQGLEVWPVGGTTAERGRQPFWCGVIRIVRCFPFTAVVAIAARQQGAADPPHQPCDTKRVVAADTFGKRLHQPRPGIGEKIFESIQLHEGRFHCSAAAARLAALRLSRPGLRLGIQLAPAVQPRRRGRKEVIQMRDAGLGLSCA